MTGRRALLVGALAVGLLGGVAPARAFRPPRYGGDVTAPLPSGLRTFDPVAMERLGEWQLARLLYDGLFRQTQQGQAAEPHLATSLVVRGAARRRVVIALRWGLRSHRGHGLTAADVVASLRRLQASPAGWLLGAVAKIRALDRQRVELLLHRSCPELSAVLAAPPASILPRGLAPRGQPDGTGAFRLVRGGPGSPVRLSAYAGHFAGRPFLDALTLVPYPRHRDEISAFYLARSLVSFQGTRLFGRSPGFATRTLKSPAVTTVALLVGRQGAVRARPVREAIYLAADKARLRQLATGAPTSAAHGPVPPVLLGRRARWRARQPAPRSAVRAKALLAAAAGRAELTPHRAADGTVAVELLVDRSRLRDMDIARKLMTDLAGAGLRVTITALDAAELARRRASGRFELALHRFTSPVLQSRYHLAAAYAAAGQARLAARVVRDLHARVTPRSRAFMRELPLIPLYHTGLRADLSARLQARQGPWGLLDWANAQLP